MRPEDLHAFLQRFLPKTAAFPGEAIVVDLIANPRAGGFTRPAYARRRFAELVELEARSRSLPLRDAPVYVRLHLTERQGHASDIALGIVEAARREPPGARRLVITAGGDGTSLETASVLVALPPAEARQFSLLRLPFGTGNDGSEGRDLIVALGRFLSPLRGAGREALRIVPNPAGGKLPLYSFNIASIGLDAYVSDMTNRLKTSFPGDSYKLWVDFASVFYDRIWPPARLSVKAFDAEGRESVAFEDTCLIFALGASGHRTYGSNKPILPDDDNACAILQMPLLKKLVLKGRISSGGHRGLDVVRLFSARCVVLDYPEAILLQRDGEVTRLEKGDFPLVMEVTGPLYTVLEAEPSAPR